MEPIPKDSKMVQQEPEQIRAGYREMLEELAHGNELTLGFEAKTALPSMNKIFMELNGLGAFGAFELGYRYVYSKDETLFFCLKLGKKEDWIWGRKLFGHEIMDWEAKAYGFEDKEVSLLKKKYAFSIRAIVDVLSSFGFTSVSSTLMLSNSLVKLFPCAIQRSR